MRVRGAASFDEYAAILDDDGREYDRLISTLTINVSKLFRNPEIFATIAATVLPDLATSGGPLIRIWSAGCASGEEAYSLAVLAHQQALSSNATAPPPRFDIVGTDVDEDAIAAARRGRYGEASFADTTPAVRDRYFPLRDGLHTASDELRSLVSFHTSDLFDRPRSSSRFHLIVCRNVVIYFQRSATERLMQRFHELLLPGGYLVLGKVESLLGKSREMFVPLKPRERIYRRV